MKTGGRGEGRVSGDEYDVWGEGRERAAGGGSAVSGATDTGEKPSARRVWGASGGEAGVERDGE